MKKIFAVCLSIIMIILGIAFNVKINAEILPVEGTPYAYDLDLQFEKTSSGEAHTLGLSQDGRVYAWGWNQYGQLGIGNTTSSNIPIDITPYLSLGAGEYVEDVASGITYSSVVTSEGRLLMWGQNVYGALGDGTTTDKLSPVDITSQFSLGIDEKIVYSSGGYYFSGAITSSGRVFTWGQGFSGQLGNGQNNDIYVPIDITSQFSLEPEEVIISLATGAYHCMALSSFGKVFAWGYNASGQLGDGMTVNKNIPFDITPNIGLVIGETVMDLEAFNNTTGIVTSLGRVLLWGDNSNGNLGDGTYVNKPNPTDISFFCNLGPEEFITDLSFGINHTGVITTDNRVLVWGLNNFYQLGDGTNTTRNLPVDITTRLVLPEGEKYKSISLGGYFSVALTTSNKVISWGNNNVGQLGDGTNNIRSIPTRLKVFRYTITENFLPVAETIIKQEFGDSWSAVITSNNRLYMFGLNQYGQLGTGSTTNSLPVDITNNFNLSIGEIITDVKLGGYSSLAITSLGRIFTWGKNTYGQLADGTASNKYLPVDVTSNFNFNEFETIKEITLGCENGFILTSDDRVFAWGDNRYGQLGVGTTTNKYLPIDVTSYFNLEVGETIELIEAGGWHTGAYTSLNRIFTWGRNDYGQLGDTTLTQKSLPNDITSLIGLLPEESFVQMSFWYLNSGVVTSTGRVLTWGYNMFGQIGDGTTVTRNYPVEITGQFILDFGETIQTIEAGNYIFTGLSSLGKVFTWGYNNDGQLGDGTLINRFTPVDITSRINLSLGETVEKISVGNCHSSILTSSGRLFAWGRNAEYQLGFSGANALSPYELNKLYDYNNEILLTYIEVKQNHLFDEYVLTILPKYQIRDEIESINISGIEYTDFENVNGRIDIHLPNIWLLHNRINLTINSINFSNSNVMTLSGNTSATLILVEDTYAPIITFDYEYDLYIEEGIGQYSYLEASALDDTTEAITVDITGYIDWSIPGEYLISYSASDISGNISTRDRMVYIMGDISVDGVMYYDMEFYYFGPDIYTPGSPPSGQIVRYNSINYYSSTDVNGFVYSSGWNEVAFEFYFSNRLVLASKPIYSDDTIPPVFDFIDTQYIEAGNYEDFDWTSIVTGASDNSLTSVTLSELTDNVLYDSTGIYTVTIRATDTSSNIYEQSFNVIVTDTQAPQLNVTEITFESGSSYYFDYNLYATDNATGTLYYNELYNNVVMEIPGVYHVDYQLYDDSGNFEIGSFIINIIDTTAPTFSIADQSISVGINESLWPFLEGVTDNSYKPIFYLEVSGYIDYAELGVYDVTVRLIDGYGNFRDQEVTITVIDDIAPSFSIANQIIEVGAYTWIDWVVYIEDIQDNYSQVFIKEVKTDGVDYGTVGVYPVTVSVTDSDGNIAEEEFSVTVIDTTVPDFQVSNQYIEAGSYTNFWWPAVITNASDNSNDFSMSEFFDGVDYDTPGVYVVAVRVTDSSGNYTQKSFDVTVIDTTAPSFDFIPDQFIEINSMVSFYWRSLALNVNDNSDTGVLLTESSSVIYTEIGDYLVRIFAQDASGNIYYQDLFVHVRDMTNPTFDFIPDQIIEIGAYTDIDWRNLIKNATDNYASILVFYEVIDSVVYDEIGNYMVVVRVVDESANYFDRVFFVDVVNTEPPTFDYIPVQIIEVNTFSDIDWTDYIINASDNAPGALIKEEYSDGVNYSEVGIYEVEVRVYDLAINMTSQTFLVEVKDTQSPVITLNGSPIIILEINYPYTEFGAFATDNYDADLEVVINGTVDITSVNTYYVTYDCFDFSNNQAIQVVRMIVVQDTLPPNFTWIEAQTLESGTYTNFDWATLITDATDNSNLEVSVVEVYDDVDYNTPGVYEVRIMVSDVFNNAVINLVYVTIEDTLPPEFMAVEQFMIDEDLYEDYDWLNLVSSFTDNSDTKIYVSVLADTVNLSQPGKYYVTVVAYDASYNMSFKTIEVIIKDITPPEFDYIMDQILEVGELVDVDWRDLVNNLSDNDSSDLVIFEEYDYVYTSIVGEYQVRVCVSDSTGNKGCQSFMVHVVDTTPPIVTLNPSVDTIRLGQEYIDQGVSVFDYSEFTVALAYEPHTNLAGTHIFIYIVRDIYGNETEVSRYVTVLDVPIDVKFVLGNAKTTIGLNEQYLDGSCTVWINQELEYECNVKESNLDITQAGIYYVTYQFFVNEEEYTYKRYIFVVDDNEPLILYTPFKKEEGLII